MKKKIVLIRIFLFFLSCLIAISSGLMNRYPLVMSDTGSYLLSGFKNTVSIDRPIVYGLFVAHTSLRSSLWLTILTQSLILNYLIFKLLELLKFRFPIILTFIFVSFLTLFSGLSLYCSQIMADIFTSFCILSLVVLLFGKEVKLIDKILITFIFILSTLTHSSHLLINLLTIALFSLLYLSFYRNKNFEKINSVNLKFAWALVIFCFFAQASINFLYDKGFKITTTQGFIIARIAESGILKELLIDQCDSENYRFCKFKNEIPKHGNQFLWDSNSPFHKTGGWLDSSGEHSKIIKKTFITPKYLVRFCEESLKTSLCQFFNYQAGEGIVPCREESSPYVHIKWLLPNEFKSYISSDQYAGKLNFTSINNYQQLVLSLSFIIIALLFLFYPISEYRDVFIISVFVIVFLASNAIVCGSFSGVFNRYQGRVEWLFILLALILILRINNRYKWLIQK